jgi:hypothetical protein
MKILSNNDVKNLKIDLKRPRGLAFENGMIINPARNKSVCLTKARVTESLNYSL